MSSYVAYLENRARELEQELTNVKAAYSESNTARDKIQADLASQIQYYNELFNSQAKAVAELIQSRDKIIADLQEEVKQLTNERNSDINERNKALTELHYVFNGIS